MTETTKTLKPALPLKQYHAVKALERLQKQYPATHCFAPKQILGEVYRNDENLDIGTTVFPQLKALVKKGWMAELGSSGLGYRLAEDAPVALCHIIGEDPPRQYGWRLAQNGRKYMCYEAGDEPKLVAVVVKFGKLWAAALVVGGRHRDYGTRRYYTAESAMDGLKPRLPEGVHGMALMGERANITVSS
jgi:hypothetical protein